MKSQSLYRVRELLDVLERTTGEPGDLTSTLQHIAQTAQAFFVADDCVIFAINPITNRFIASLMIAGDLLEEKVSFEQPRPEGLAQEVLRRGVLLVEDLEAMQGYQSTFTRSEGIRSFAALALRMKYRQKPLGVLYLNFRQPQQFDPDDHELFQLFADQASFILQETWLLRRYQEVAHIGEEINHELATVDILFQKLQKHVAGILDTSYAFLLAVYQPQTSTLDLYLEEQGRSIILVADPLEGACQYVIETQETLFIRHLSNEVEHLPFQRVEIKGTGLEESLIFVPLVLRGVPLGVLSIQHPKPNTYNQEDLFILRLLANHIGLALHNIRLYNSLSRLNETGQLLTQQLDSEQVLQATAYKIQEATKADIVVLYPYEPDHERFVLPPRVAGTLLDSTSFQSMSPSRPDDIAELALRHIEPIFAKESATMYTALHGDLRTRQGSFQQREKIRSTASVPLRVGDESVGVLFVNFRQQQHFNSPQKLLIEGLAHYAAIAIKNAQVFGTLFQRRVRELEILQDIDRELSRTLELEPVLNTLLRLAHEHVPAEEVSILLHNPQTQVLETAAAIGRHAEDSRKQFISLQETKGITRWVLENKKPARVNNVHNELPWRNLHFPVAADTVSELDVPLLDGEEVVGVLNFESIREEAFSQEDQDFLLTLAGQAVLAIKNAQAYEREKRFVQAGQELGKITDLTQLEQAYDVVLQIAEEHSQGQVVIRRYDENTEELELTRASLRQHFPPLPRMKLEEGINGQVAREQRTIVIYDTNNPPSGVMPAKLEDPTIHSLVITPIKFKDRYYGNLGLSHEDVGYFRGSDVNFFEGLAQQLASTIYWLEVAEARQEFEKRALSAEEMSSIGQSAFEITHRLGNNLGLVESYVNDIQLELETQGITSTFISKKLKNIVRAVRTVLDLSGELKHELARSGAIEEMAGEPVIIPPGVLFEEAKAALSLPSNIQISLEIDDDVGDIRIIPSLVTDILRNLVTNAIEAMPAGGKITLRAYNAGRSVALEVIDSGIGIPVQKLPKIFDLFFSTKGSSGFGLWSARRNALRNHGELKVESQPGQGTTFMLLLPRIEEGTL